MRTLLVVTKQPSFADAIDAVLEEGKFQLIIKEDVADAEFLLARGAIDAAILDLELTDTRAIRAIDELRSFAPVCPMLVFTGAKQWEWEEDAYLKGVAHVLTKPVRAKLLNTLLARFFPVHEPKATVEAAPDHTIVRYAAPQEPLRALEALRRFSAVLSQGLDAAGLLKEFLMLLREVIGVNRAIIFLRKPASILSSSPLSAEDRWLRPVCAIGLDQNVLQHFALSLGAGIGGFLHRQGRILRAGSAEAQGSREIGKEFQLLGAQVAIPILDRQSLLGVAIFDERLTGEAFVNGELALIFHMLEEVGLAVRNSWLHQQLQANHAMIAGILAQLGTGCVVIGANLAILHANEAAARIMLDGREGKGQLEFADLPQQLGSMVFTVTKTGVPVAAFKHRFAHRPDVCFRVGLMPFATQGAAHANAALLIIEDITEHERAQKLELEAGSLRLVKAMAEHLAHEIGNSLVPLSTHQQLLASSMGDPEFQESLSTALSGGVKRIARLANQMQFLAREWTVEFDENVHIADLIVEAFQDAHTYQPGKKVAQLSFNKNVAPWKVAGDSKALRHAFSEIMLNALQANPDAPTVTVRLDEGATGSQELQVEVRDSGKGFTAESAARGSEPFFSTRSVGLGIGLTVSRRIVESHGGRMEIPASTTGESGMVRISLPISTLSSALPALSFSPPP